MLPEYQVLLWALCIIPLAILLGKTTDHISDYIGEKKGGLLTATIGNLPELVMGFWSLRYGMVAMAKASIIGTILCNILLGVGVAIIYGGVKYKEQSFNKNIARTNFHMLILSLSIMIILSTLNEYAILSSHIQINISVKISFLLILVYILSLVFSLFTHRTLFESNLEEEKKKKNKSFFIFLLRLGIIAIFLNIISEKLVLNLELCSTAYNVSEEFLGIILIPLLGNIGEIFSAIMSAGKNKINLSLETSIGSSIQMSLFVLPILVIAAFLMGIEMNLIFTIFQVIMTVVTVIMSYIVFQDGKTYWFEGAILLAVYFVITLAYYYAV